VYLILAFFTGAVLAGLLVHRQGSGRIRELDTRHAFELRGATETIGRLTVNASGVRRLFYGERKRGNDSDFRKFKYFDKATKP
jgi:hypothetical protein